MVDAVGGHGTLQISRTSRKCLEYQERPFRGRGVEMAWNIGVNLQSAMKGVGQHFIAILSHCSAGPSSRSDREARGFRVQYQAFALVGECRRSSKTILAQDITNEILEYSM